MSKSSATTNSVSSGGVAAITELYADPVSPAPQSAWVLATALSSAGSPMGLLLSLTQANNTYTYTLKYRTLEGTTIGTPLT